ncbi:MAG: hypothetical protein SVM79_08965 [Chloroflexota bacterium]|nr:hypothetical protein [Chloroflexota bacterium]
MFRKITVVLPFIILASLLVSCSNQPVDSTITDAYDFPIKPGSEEWESFRDHDSMVKACQVPELTLEEMSTAGLVETILNYPLRIDAFAYNDPQTGFDAVKSQFNGIQELLTREDAATELIVKYKALDLSAVNEEWEPKDIGEFTLGTVAFMEILIAQHEIISKMTKSELLDLLTEAIEKNSEKLQYSESFGQSGRLYSTWIIARVLQQENYMPFIQIIDENDNLQWYLSRGQYASTELLDEINSKAQEFLSQP